MAGIRPGARSEPGNDLLGERFFYGLFLFEPPGAVHGQLEHHRALLYHQADVAAHAEIVGLVPNATDRIEEQLESLRHQGELFAVLEGPLLLNLQCHVFAGAGDGPRAAFPGYAQVGTGVHHNIHGRAHLGRHQQCTGILGRRSDGRGSKCNSAEDGEHGPGMRACTSHAAIPFRAVKVPYPRRGRFCPMNETPHLRTDSHCVVARAA